MADVAILISTSGSWHLPVAVVWLLVEGFAWSQRVTCSVGFRYLVWFLLTQGKNCSMGDSQPERGSTARGSTKTNFYSS